MNLSGDIRAPRTVRWGIVGVSLTTFAVGFATLGIALTLQQTQDYTVQLLSHAQLRARQISASVSSVFHQQGEGLLLDVAREECLDTTRPHSSFVAWPEWIGAVMVRRGDSIRIVRSAQPGDDDESRGRIRARLQLASVEEVWDLDAPTGQSMRITDAKFDNSFQPPILIASLYCKPAQARVTAAGCIDAEAFRILIVEPMLAQDESLELIHATSGDNPWAQSLSGPMSGWSIRPTPTLLDEQRRTIVGQTVVYAALTVLALGSVLGAMWFVLRLTRREVALAELKSNFVADVSHELKTPLAVIRLFSETLQSGRVIEESKRQEYYGIITRESGRLTNLINNILDFARIEAGRKQYVIEPTDVEVVIQETYDVYRQELDLRQFEHDVRIERPLPRVNIDADAIAQVLVNLINNAVKYSAEDKYVGIHVRADTRRGRKGIVLSVEDRGIGIRPDERGRVFEGFFRADDGRVQRQGGTGLGLTLVKHIVDAHGGYLDVEPRLIKGTAFRIFLPASEQQDPSPTNAG